MTQRYDRYDGWAWLYNRTVGPEYGKEQFALLKRILLPNIRPGSAILDLCCGTGQLIKPLLQAGYAVTGLDGSEDMLKAAAENAPKADFLLLDARDFKTARKYDAVFSTSASLNHIENLEDLSKVFQNVHACMNENATFLFDLNHHAQLSRWWRGSPTEGEIEQDHAWMITPYYDAEKAQGRFTVTIFSDPEYSGNNLVSKLFKQPLYKLLSLPRLIGLRLRLITHFSAMQPGWKQEDIDYPVYGHDIDAVSKLLRDTGFKQIRVESIDGKELDENHSAHFICTRAAVAETVMAEATT